MHLRQLLADLSRKLGQIEQMLAVALLATMTIVVSLQVFFRYILGQPLVWSEELARLLQVWLTYIAVGKMLSDRAHIEVDFFARLLPPAARVVLATLTDILIALFSVVLINAGIALAQVQMGSASTALRIPTAFFSMPLVLASILVLLHLPDLVARRWEEFAAGRAEKAGGQP